jgi:hypothetical protein
LDHSAGSAPGNRAPGLGQSLYTQTLNMACNTLDVSYLGALPVD